MAIEWLPVGAGIAKVLIRAGWQNDTLADGVGDAANTIQVLRTLRGRTDAHTALGEHLAGRLSDLLEGQAVAPGDEGEFQEAVDEAGKVVARLANNAQALLAAVRNPDEFPQWVQQHGGGAKTRERIASVAEGFFDRVLAEASRTLSLYAPNLRTFEVSALELLLNQVTGGLEAPREAVGPPPERPAGPVIVGRRPDVASHFVSRPQLDEFRGALGTEGTATLCQLRGMRGVGKTQIAAAYARECEESGWDVVAWIDSEQRESLERGVLDLAQACGISTDDNDIRGITARLHASFASDRTKRRVVVFDNVEDFDLLGEFRPRSAAQVVVTTTRTQVPVGTPIDIPTMPHDVAIDYLIERTGDRDRDGAASVATELGGLALALAQAAYVMVRRGYGYAAYLEALASQPLDDVLEAEEGGEYPRSTASAIRLALETALDQARDRDLARSLLSAVARLAAPGTPVAWLRALGTDAVVDRVVSDLVAGSILARSADHRQVSLHQLTRRVVLEGIDDPGAVSADSQGAVVALACAIVASIEEPDYWRRRGVLAQTATHLAVLSGQPESRAVIEASDVIGLVANLLLETNMADMPLVGIALADVVKASERVLGPDHPGTLASRGNLANAYQSAGDLARAIPLYEATLTDSERVLGPDHPHTLASRNNLANAYQSTGDLGRAIPLYEATLTDSGRVLGRVTKVACGVYGVSS